MPALAEDLSGSLLSTFCIAIFLYGTATSQIYNYWQNFPYDYKLHRWTVGVVWLIDTIHTVLCVIAIYCYIIIDHGDLERMIHIVWSLAAAVATEVMLAGIVQSLYIRRVWILSQKKIRPLVVFTLSLRTWLRHSDVHVQIRHYYTVSTKSQSSHNCELRLELRCRYRSFTRYYAGLL